MEKILNEKDACEDVEEIPTWVEMEGAAIFLPDEAPSWRDEGWFITSSRKVRCRPINSVSGLMSLVVNNPRVLDFEN